MVNWVRLKAANPCLVTESEYSPGCTVGNEYLPDESDRVLRTTPVWVFVSTLSAPAIAAPERSVTVPSIEDSTLRARSSQPVLIHAGKDASTHKMNANFIRTVLHLIDIFVLRLLSFVTCPYSLLKLGSLQVKTL